MAVTLSNESSLGRRQAEIARELALFKRLRIAEWSGAVLCLAAGILIKLSGGGVHMLVLGAILVFIALGHETRRRESEREFADAESVLGAKKDVARLLDEKLANDHFVLNDLHLKVGREKCWIDHLVVAPSGIFVLNTLNWSGKIIGDTSKQAHVWKIRSANAASSATGSRAPPSSGNASTPSSSSPTPRPKSPSPTPNAASSPPTKPSTSSTTSASKNPSFPQRRSKSSPRA